MREYGPQLRAAADRLAELARAGARRIYADDLERGYVTVLGEMVAGGVSDAGARGGGGGPVEPWSAIVGAEARAAPSRLAVARLWVPPAGSGVRDRHRLDFGVDMLTQLQRDRRRALSHSSTLPPHLSGAGATPATCPQQRQEFCYEQETGSIW